MMTNLIRAGLVKLFKSKRYYITALITALSPFLTMQYSGLYWGSDCPNAIDFHVAEWLNFVPIAVVAVTCLFCDGDYRAGAIRNKIVVELTKLKIYLSNFAVCFVGGADSARSRAVFKKKH